MSGQRSDLPFGSEFSPSQIDLPTLLEIANAEQGNPRALEAAILQKWFSDHAARPDDEEARNYNRRKLANNCKLGMIAYGLIDREAQFTDFGKRLFELRGDEIALYAELARHILLNLRGMTLVQCLLDMVAAGEEITLDSLRAALAERGVHFPPGGKHPSMMRLWLAKAGVITGSRWQVSTIKLREVLGIDPNDFPALAKFSPQQKSFLLALVNMGVREPQPANEVARLAAATYGVRFPDKSLPKEVLHALVNAGYIVSERTTTGRGAKPSLVSPTAKAKTEILEPLLDQLRNQVDPKVIQLLRKPLSEIREEMKSSDRYIAGLALEALAFKLMRSLAMDYVATRLRASATGGAEVDLIFQSSRLVYSRWQVQCKNTTRVSLDDVAKEVGLTHFLKSTVIVVITTGQIGGEARKYANRIMSETNLAIVMVDGSDLDSIETNASYLLDAFRREAEHAMTLKKIEYGEGFSA